MQFVELRRKATFLLVIGFDGSSTCTELSDDIFDDKRFDGWSEEGESWTHCFTAYSELCSDGVFSMGWALWINCSILFTNETQPLHNTFDLVSSSENFYLTGFMDLGTQIFWWTSFAKYLKHVTTLMRLNTESANWISRRNLRRSGHTFRHFDFGIMHKLYSFGYVFAWIN